jgi:protoporphyrinogen oxidase
LWEIVAGKVAAQGGEIITGFNVDKILVEGNRVCGVSGIASNGERRDFRGEYLFSTMAVKDLVNCLDCDVPGQVREISDALLYRDFITVGLLVKKLVVQDEGRPGELIKDNWIYIQEPDVIAGRLQIFNNWSPFLVRDPGTVWIGVEYFCNESDSLWNMSEDKLAALAQEELEKIGIIRQSDVLDATVIRMEKTYPAYFGSYARFPEVRQYLDTFENLFLIGRNGMHRYNNQDHSMLTAMTAVDNIVSGQKDKSNIWAVNSEEEYHEDGRTPAVEVSGKS